MICSNCLVSEFYSRGFVLVSVLWFVALLSVALAYVAELIDSGFLKAFDEKNKIELALSQHSTEQTLLYLLATRERSYQGIQVDRKYSPREHENPFSVNSFKPVGHIIRFDQTKYSGFGDCQYSIQDANSLVSLRSSRLKELRRLLLSMGKTNGQVEDLIAKLKDYTDRDNRSRLGGAEQNSYSALGLEHFPRNRYLNNPVEITNILSWEQQFSPEELKIILSEVSIYPADQLNFNFMTKRRLHWFLGQEAAEKIIDFRRTGYFSSLQEVKEITGIVNPDLLFGVSFFPSNHILLKIHCGREATDEWMGVTMTPKSIFQPWEIDYRLGVLSDKGDYEKIARDNRSTEKKVPFRHPVFSKD